MWSLFEETEPEATEDEQTAETTQSTEAPTEAPTQPARKDVTLKLGKNDFSMGVGYEYTIPLVIV